MDSKINTSIHFSYKHQRNQLTVFAASLIYCLMSISAVAQEPKSTNTIQSVQNDLSELSDQLEAYSEATPDVRKFPNYPIAASRIGIEGWASYSFEVESDGSVSNIELLDSSGYKHFEIEGKKALSQWVYNPATSDGMPIKSGNYTVQLDFILGKDDKNGTMTGRFKNRLSEAQEALDNGDLIKAKELIAKLDNKGQHTRLEIFFFSLLEADYYAAAGNILLEADAFKEAYRYLSKDWQDENRRSYAFGRMFKLYINTQQYHKAIDVFEKAQKTSSDQALLEDLNGVVVQINNLLKNGGSIKRSGYIRENYFWYHDLSYKNFSIIDLDGELDKLLVRCDRETAVYNFKSQNTWSIPASWGECSVLLEGKADSTFTLVESKV